MDLYGMHIGVKTVNTSSQEVCILSKRKYRSRFFWKFLGRRGETQRERKNRLFRVAFFMKTIFARLIWLVIWLKLCLFCHLVVLSVPSVQDLWFSHQYGTSSNLLVLSTSPVSSAFIPSTIHRCSWSSHCTCWVFAQTSWTMMASGGFMNCIQGDTIYTYELAGHFMWNRKKN